MTLSTKFLNFHYSLTLFILLPWPSLIFQLDMSYQLTEIVITYVFSYSWAATLLGQPQALAQKFPALGRLTVNYSPGRAAAPGAFDNTEYFCSPHTMSILLSKMTLEPFHLAKSQGVRAPSIRKILFVHIVLCVCLRESNA